MSEIETPVDPMSPAPATVETEPDHSRPTDIRAATEALLVVAEGAVTTDLVAQALGVPAEVVLEVLSGIALEYESAGRGMRLRQTAAGWQWFAATEYTDLVRQTFMEQRSARLSQAALETLAVVAYRQPVSRSRVSSIRGVGVDAVMRTLVSRGLVEEVGVEDGTGAILYGTSEAFLTSLGLRSLTELPDLSDQLPDIDSIFDLNDVTSM